MATRELSQQNESAMDAWSEVRLERAMPAARSRRQAEPTMRFLQRFRRRAAAGWAKMTQSRRTNKRRTPLERKAEKETATKRKTKRKKRKKMKKKWRKTLAMKRKRNKRKRKRTQRSARRCC